MDRDPGRIALARRIIDFGLTADDLTRDLSAAPAAALLETTVTPRPVAAREQNLALRWPAGLAPTVAPLVPTPSVVDALPEADYLVITWTVAEALALADVLAPGVGPAKWYRYAKDFEEKYVPQIRRGAPALAAQRLASYLPVTIGGTRVLLVKSELHMNQDGVKTGEGTATLPVADFFRQIIAEVKPKLLVTTGTAGAVYLEHQLGDVMVTRAAKFRAKQEFRKETWADQLYTSDFELATGQFETAKALLAVHADKLTEPDFGPPTVAYRMPGRLLPGLRHEPRILRDGIDFPRFHPILTTDFFEFGTSTNHLDELGCGVEMGDAVVGLVTAEMDDPPRWLVIRNASDPQINGDLPKHPDVQAMWAVWYYEQYGYWTTVSSAIATWAVIASDLTPVRHGK